MYSLLTRREDMLLARAAARVARAALAARFTTTADIATCLDPLPEQRAHSPLIFDPLQFPFDEGAAASVDTPPLCGVIDDFLTEEECGRLIALSTSRGYESVNATIQHGDVPAPKKGSKMSDRGLNLSGRVLIESERFAELLWERLAPIFPPASRNGWEPIGLNEHFRFLRYQPGDYFRPHRDANYVPEATDPRHGEVTSFQSLLLYLDSPRKGGETYFPLRRTGLQEDNQVVAMSTVKISPRPGRALCFDHSLEHGGTDIQEGLKHVVRTDVMYRCLPGTVPPKWATAKIRYMT